ncbi:hypothetical protein JW977_00700, partial [Candidatus Falkowbacteria bacterium]|nr:hypothetical protein [Candidatus Falkowbacteria bacterium]
LISINFLVISWDKITYIDFFKWLIISLLVNIIIYRLFRFKINISDLYKELPIIIYLIIYCTNALKLMQPFNLIIAAFLAIVYLLLLYNEYKFKKISSII